MKKYFLKLLGMWLFCTVATTVQAQTLKTSDEISLPNRADMYSILGKLNDHFLLTYAEKGSVSVVFFDENLKKTGSRDLDLERQNDAKVIDIFDDKIGFYVAYSTRRKGRDIVKIHRYDSKAKLTDSATVYEWERGTDVKHFKAMVSEDHQKLLLHTNLENYDKDFYGVSIRLDSLKTVWARKIKMDDRNDFQLLEATDPLQILFSNDGTMHMLRQLDNRKNKLEQHRISIFSIFGETMNETVIKLPNFVCIDVRFAYDNLHKNFVGAALVSKDYGKAQGYVLLNSKNAPPPVSDGKKQDFFVFDDEFVSLVEKKKITNNKGLESFKIRDLVLRKDGGCVVLAERVTERRHQSAMGSMNPMGFGMRDASRSLISMDYYHDDIIAISLHADGAAHWKSVCYKRQFSQNDGGIYGSYFLAKTTQHIRLMYNDEIERSTTLSEYVLDGDGVNERRTFFNTEGLDLSIRFRDAVQISKNEIIAPSEMRSQLRLVKITF